MTITSESVENRLDRAERILAETVAGLAEVRAIQAEAATRQAEAEARQADAEARQAEAEARQAKAATRQAEAAAASEERLSRIEAMVEANTTAIAALGKKVDQLTEQQQRNNRDLSVIKGWQTEAVVARNAREIFTRLAPNGILMRIFPKDEIGPYMNAATRHNFMTKAEVDNAGAIDFLMEGTDYAGAPVSFAIEVSYTAGMDDIRRAVERAPLIAKMLGREAVLPAVAAEVISEDFEENARTYKVNWAYVPNGNRMMQ